MNERGEELFRRLTAIGRPLDTGWATNRIVAGLTPVAGAVGAGVQLASTGVGAEVVQAGVVSALAFFGGWALARELTPDAQTTAFVAAAFAWLMPLTLPGSGVLLLFVAMVATRIVNRTVGLPATFFDALGAIGLVVWAMLSTGNAALGVVLAAAFLLDGLLEPRHPKGLARAGATVVITVTLALEWVALPWGSAPLGRLGLSGISESLGGVSGTLLLPLVVLLVATARLFRTAGSIESVGDYTGEFLSPARIRAGQLVTVGFALAPLLLGSESFTQVAPLWAAVMGASVIAPRGPREPRPGG